MKDKFRILVVGAGSAGVDLLHQLLKAEFVELVCVCDLDENAPGIKLAKEHGIPTGKDSLEVLEKDTKIDIVMNVTGVKKVRESLRTFMLYSDNHYTVIMHERISALMVSLSKGVLVPMKEEDNEY
jgi:acetaldehyde dehydrogenase (acetylating)